MAGIQVALWVDDPQEVIDYYHDVLGFNVVRTRTGEDGRATHGTLNFDGSNWLLIPRAVESPGSVARVLEKLREGGPRGAGFLLYVDVGDRDIDAFYDSVVAKGAKIVEPLQDQFFGERTFRMEDPFGYVLTFSRKLAEREAR